jgi:hypothetical protein
MDTITISGQQFNVAPRYEEGHELTAGEASALNQTLFENIRNNLASRHKKDGADALTQEHVDAYAAEYQFGIRTPGVSRDPVKSEFMTLARAQLRQKLKASGRTASAEAITAAAEKLYSDPRGENLRQLAAQRVQEKKAVATENLDDILGSIPADEQAAA